MPPASSSRIAITGFGLVTPLGLSAWSTFRALLDGRTLTDRLEGWSPATTTEMQAEIVCAAGHVGRVRHAAQDPAIDLAEIAAREALEMAGGDPAGMSCFIGASKGAVHALTHATDGLKLSGVAPGARPWSAANGYKNARAATMGPVGYLAHHLRQRLNLGPTRGIVAACASGLTALHAAGLELLKNKDSAGRILVVSSEAALLPMFIHSYRRLGVLPLSADPATYRGRPLDRQRSGFILVEQAAAVVLEYQSAAPSLGPRPSAPGPDLCLLDTAVASEGFDLVRPAPGMPALEHVARQLLVPGPIDVLHPHATGTLDNDEAEMAVYARVLSDAPVNVPTSTPVKAPSVMDSVCPV